MSSARLRTSDGVAVPATKLRGGVEHLEHPAGAEGALRQAQGAGELDGGAGRRTVPRPGRRPTRCSRRGRSRWRRPARACRRRGPAPAPAGAVRCRGRAAWPSSRAGTAPSTRHGTRPCSPATWAARRARASVTSRSVPQASRPATPSASQSAAAAWAAPSARAGPPRARCSSTTCLGPGDRRRGELAGVGRPARAERGVGAQDQRARVARPAGAGHVGLRIGPGPGGDRPCGRAAGTARRGRRRAGASSSAAPSASASAARPTRVSTVTRSAIPPRRAGRRPRPGRRRQQVLGAAQRAAGGVPAGQPQQQRHRRVRLARLDEQLGGARLVVRAGALGEHPGHPPGQRRPFRRQQDREHGVPGERVRPAQGRPVGHQQRLPDRGPQGAQHLLLGGAGRGREQPPVELGAAARRRCAGSPGPGPGSAASRSATSAASVGGTAEPGAASELLDGERQPVGAQQQALGLLVGDRPAAPACCGQRRHVPPAQPGEVQGDRPGCGGEAAGGVGRGVVARGAGQQDGGVGGGAREVLDEREGVVVGPVQVLQAQHTAGRVAEREAQQPQQALGEDDDGIRARPACRSRRPGSAQLGSSRASAAR